MQYKAIALSRCAPLAVALAALCIAFSPGRAAERLARGSGVVVGSRGEILTNAHVVKDCTRISVRPPSGHSFAARVIARDDKNDLAVVTSDDKNDAGQVGGSPLSS